VVTVDASWKRFKCLTCGKTQRSRASADRIAQTGLRLQGVGCLMMSLLWLLIVGPVVIAVIWASVS
jgi:hypothetical protein